MQEDAPLTWRIFELQNALDAGDESARAQLEREFVELEAARSQGELGTFDAAQAYAWLSIGVADWPEVPPSIGLTSLELLERASEVARGAAALNVAVIAECYLASQMRNSGRAAEAHARLERLLPEFAGALRRPLLLVQLGQCARILGDLARAQEWVTRAEQALGADVAASDPVHTDMQCRAASLRFEILLQLGLTDRAFEALEREGGLAKLLADPAALAEHALHRAAFAQATDNWAEAIRQTRELLSESSVALLTSDWRAVAETTLAGALSDLARTDPALEREAAEAFERALSESALSAIDRVLTEIRLADLERRRGQLDRAREHLRDARAHLTQVGSVAQSFGPFCLAAVEASVALDAGDDADALAARLGTLERSYAAFLDEWASVPERRDGVAFLQFTERRALVAEVVRLTLTVHGREAGAVRALEHLLRAQSLGSLARILGGEPASLAEVRRELCGEQRGALVYLPGPERSFVFAFDAQSTRCVELPPSVSWEATRQDLFTLLSRPPGDQRDRERRASALARLSLRLAEDLLPAEVAATMSDWRELSIVGIDLLGYLPFEVLPLPRGEWLGLCLATAYLPSLAVGCQLARRANASPLPVASLCLLAAPTDPPAARVANLSWPAIEWGADHERALRRLYGSGGFSSASGDGASLAALRAWAGSCSVLEIVAHGFYAAESEPPPGLVLAESSGSDGLVRCGDVEHLALGPVVVLAVCGAGRGPLRSGDDGVSNLGGAFFKAGAQCVLLSPVDLEQHATEALLLELHRNLVRGATPAMAMLAARRELASDERYRDPFFHSTLQVVGLGHRHLVAPSTGVGYGASGSVVLVLALATGGALALIGGGVWLLARGRRSAHD